MKDYNKPAVYQGKDKERAFERDRQFHAVGRTHFQPAIGKSETSLKPILQSHRLLDRNQTEMVTPSPDYRVPFMKSKDFINDAPEEGSPAVTPTHPVNAKQAEHWEQSASQSSTSTHDYAIPFLKKPQASFQDGRKINPKFNGSVQEALFDASMVGPENRNQTPISNQADKQGSSPFVYQPAIKETKSLVQESFFDEEMKIKENLVNRSYGEQVAHCLDIRSISKRMIKSKTSFLLFENEEE